MHQKKPTLTSLIRYHLSAGVSQLLVAVNKMDTVDWSQVRYDEIVKKLGTFLKQTGFKEADVSYVPCSGLIGENLTKPSKIPELCSWYNGPCVVQQIGMYFDVTTKSKG